MQQLDFIAAVKCLKSKPAKTTSLYPGAITRYDDYVALHIAMTERIHFVACIDLFLESYVAETEPGSILAMA